ncbi:Outer membrane usher protein fimD precursor [Serratia grimesii]|nr:FimD/PapC N-terminal domain-containing protein [Serratia grimesii]ULG12714.1 fimbrial protein FimD [Serratia grimesii]CAI2793727.1 Outer membrane usher protein fimD precursor [Serratia grimesii]
MNNLGKYPPRRYRHVLTPLTMILLSASIPSKAADLWFPPSLVSTETVADLAYFEKGGQSPGQYQVDIWLNDTLIASRELLFVIPQDSLDFTGVQDNTGLMACLTRKDLQELMAPCPGILTASLLPYRSHS